MFDLGGGFVVGEGHRFQLGVNLHAVDHHLKKEHFKFCIDHHLKRTHSITKSILKDKFGFLAPLTSKHERRPTVSTKSVSGATWEKGNLSNFALSRGKCF